MRISSATRTFRVTNSSQLSPLPLRLVAWFRVLSSPNCLILSGSFVISWSLFCWLWCSGPTLPRELRDFGHLLVDDGHFLVKGHCSVFDTYVNRPGTKLVVQISNNWVTRQTQEEMSAGYWLVLLNITHMWR